LFAELNALLKSRRKFGMRATRHHPTAQALRTKIDRGLDFEILCDLDNTLALECGLMFPVPDEIRAAYMERNIDFVRIYGNEAWLLPTPATYIVRQDGVIASAYVNPDFRYRLEPAEIVKALATLR
jgi:peroxiredoxin